MKKKRRWMSRDKKKLGNRNPVTRVASSGGCRTRLPAVDVTRPGTLDTHTHTLTHTHTHTRTHTQPYTLSHTHAHTHSHTHWATHPSTPSLLHPPAPYTSTPLHTLAPTHPLSHPPTQPHTHTDTWAPPRSDTVLRNEIDKWTRRLKKKRNIITEIDWRSIGFVDKESSRFFLLPARTINESALTCFIDPNGSTRCRWINSVKTQ